MRRRPIALALLALVLLVGAGCGGDDDDSDTSTGTTAKGATTTVDTDFSGKGSNDFCTAAKKYSDDSSLGNLTGSDPAALKKTYERFESIVKDLEDKAPSEIKADVKVIADAFTALVGELERVNYDFTKVDASKLQVLSSSDFAAAGQRLSAYGSKVCGIQNTTTTAAP